MAALSVTAMMRGASQPDQSREFIHTPMKKTSKNMPARPMTRREFVGGALTTAGVIAGAPAFLRGQNLNRKLDIAFIACGGRANASLGELTLVPGGSGAGGKKGGGGGKKGA